MVAGADYTQLSSFGSAQDFGSNLVQSMDRSYELRRGAKPKKPVVVRWIDVSVSNQ